VLQRKGQGGLNASIKIKNQELGPMLSGAGFTLLEILIAIFIFSIVVTTLFVSYNSVFTGAATIDRGITSYETAKACLDRMIFDLKSVYVSLRPHYTPPGFDDPADPYRFTAETVYIKNNDFPRLRFASLAHLSLRRRIEEGIAEIIYYVQESEDRGYVLRRADSLYPFLPFEEKKSDPVLCEGIQSLVFKFYDQEGTEYELWDSDAEDFGFSTPSSIGIKLELGNAADSELFETRVTPPVQREKKK
jgi:general secretion pathway protein J